MNDSALPMNQEGLSANVRRAPGAAELEGGVRSAAVVVIQNPVVTNSP